MTESIVIQQAKGGALAKLAAILADQASFREFLSVHLPEFGEIETAAQATALVKQICGVESRKEFDNDSAAADRFHDRVRIPYVNWQLGRGQ